jgi:hypothetical protein
MGALCDAVGSQATKRELTLKAKRERTGKRQA